MSRYIAAIERMASHSSQPILACWAVLAILSLGAVRADGREAVDVRLASGSKIRTPESRAQARGAAQREMRIGDVRAGSCRRRRPSGLISANLAYGFWPAAVMQAL